MRKTGYGILFLLTSVLPLAGAEPTFVRHIPENDFDRLQKIIKPQPGESSWRAIPWLTDLRQAREKAAKENKPLLVFTAADGNPLGRI